MSGEALTQKEEGKEMEPHTQQGSTNTQAQISPRLDTQKENLNTQIHQPQNSASRQQIIDDILDYKEKISILLGNVRGTKNLCEKYENNNQYLQDYVGTLMKNQK